MEITEQFKAALAQGICCPLTGCRNPQQCTARAASTQSRVKEVLNAIEQHQENEWKPTHQHIQRGTNYRVLGDAFANVAKGRDIGGTCVRVMKDRDLLILYQDEDGEFQVRYPDEFYDGRFKDLTENIE